MDDLWSQVLKYLKERLSPSDFNTWIVPINHVDIRGDIIDIYVPNKDFANRILNNFYQIITNGLFSVGGKKFYLEVSVDENNENVSEPDRTLDPPPFFRGIKRFTFSTFVVGSSNQFAHAACYNVANSPGENYNPLFIYGGVGLGKTHLLNAIGHMITENHPDWKIFYLSSEQFMNELIQALQFEKMIDFRRRYREQCDVILIDDIQFMSGKDRTQEEFFHTFNALHQSGKQIVVTSDLFPQDIPELEERLRSRFQWGLIADIKPPEMETRVAILKKKAEVDKIFLPDDVAIYIALEIKSNVRELEGCLTRLFSYSKVMNSPITKDLAKQVLRGIIKDKPQKVSIEKIQSFVCSYFGITIKELCSNRRTKQLVFPRQIAMYLCRKNTSASFPEIGSKFGGKDHTTVMFGVKRIDKSIESGDNEVIDVIDSIESSLGLK
ncbi:MAG: chromosomal replication initiator protein DnaA [Deltaproteobacteria bacterium]|nr:chromosomal replication initiator protein DnaA [Deltaproteobacteria bacterium]